MSSQGSDLLMCSAQNPVSFPPALLPHDSIAGVSVDDNVIDSWHNPVVGQQDPSLMMFTNLNTNFRHDNHTIPSSPPSQIAMAHFDVNTGSDIFEHGFYEPHQEASP